MSRKPDAWPGDEPDWYGEKAKRKNDQPVNNARLWGVVSILASLAVIVAGCAIITVILANPFNQRDALINTPVPSTSVVVVPSATPFPRPTLIPTTITPPTPLSTEMMTAMVLRLYNQSGEPVGNPNESLTWSANNLLRGLRYVGYKLYVGQMQSPPAANCDTHDTFWQISNQMAVSTANFGRLVNPKALIEVPQGVLILASECTKPGMALFLINPNPIVLYDVFPIIGGDALVNVEGRILVALSGFAGGDQQYHWIELKIVSTETGSAKLEQVEQYMVDDKNAVYRSAAYDSSIGLVFIRSTPGTEMLQVAHFVEGNLTVYKSISLPVALTDLGFDRLGRLYALDRSSKSIVRFDSDLTNFTSIPLKNLTPYSFAIDPDGLFAVAGYPDSK